MEKPIRNYFGSKNGAGVSQQIINEIRPHDIYLELFLGSGAIYLNKKPASISIINDIDPKVVKLWEGSGIAVFNLDAIKILQEYIWISEYRYCIYLDPPYPLNSRRSSVATYDYEISDSQHEELLQCVVNLPSNVDVLISTYENDIYKKYLSSWRLKTFSSQTRKGPAIEYLYMNYQNATGILHDYSFLGQDRTDRQRIKRKIAREVSRLKSLPVSERNAIITEVLSCFVVDANNFTGV